MPKPTGEKAKVKEIKKTAAGRGRLYIFSGFNNSIFTITHSDGRKIDQFSSRTVTGYSGSKKATLWAAQEATKKVLATLAEFGISSIKITTSGIGNGAKAALNIIREAQDKLQVEKIEGKISLPFNGCRPRKAPRK